MNRVTVLASSGLFSAGDDTFTRISVSIYFRILSGLNAKRMTG